MLECHHCHLRQHGACYRILAQDQVPALHCCLDCSHQGKGACTDPKLFRMVEKSRGKEAALRSTLAFRRVLVLLLNITEVSVRLSVSLVSPAGLLRL